MQIPGCRYTEWDLLGLETSLSGPTGIARDTKHLPSLTCQSFCARFLSYEVILSSAGLSIQIPGCQYTEWDPLGLATSLSGPTGIARESGTPNTSLVLTCQSLGARFLSYEVILSSAGLSMQIPGCRYTEWGPLGLATSLSGPTGVARDTKHLLSLTLAHAGDLLSF